MSLYGLKQSGHAWYNYLSKYLLKEWYNDDRQNLILLLLTCILMMYIDDLNIN